MATTVTNIFFLLQHLETDNVVGINVGHLAGDDSLSFFGAGIDPGKSVTAHYHEKGIEIYFIVSGSGLMGIGRIKDDEQIAWTGQFAVGAGDCFAISPGEVHQLKNRGHERLVVIFGCTKAHLSTDRTLV